MDGLHGEAGGQRVQRVPAGQREGRVQSSTVTVSVIAGTAADAVAKDHPALRRAPQDFALEWYSGSGCGGQHRNRHRNSARLRHLPTGLVATAQCRSRPESEMRVRADLMARLDAMLAAGEQAAMNGIRAGQIGCGSKADKFRTWRFQDGRGTDHVTGRSAPIDQVLRGGLDLLWR
ncbi:hypothetical protein LAZ40_04375 [Cereibacter sphaeroides]|uniref:peptide chain release factor-like protein n=1 Tax=Cereibacter sphaeroides TaxID=1063 RepID=UPI001F1A7E69|nr:peptide chain release factor-like protein [Cereibacter sphaeroides]MCE6958291.1 hypothetical protein [Cereibacter sphaeroides]MCE6971901.1 hypothetical protein [Cereibacter sphaeroides]